MANLGEPAQRVKRRVHIILPVWATVVAWMVLWWVQPGRISFLPLYIPLSFALLYEFIILPSVFLYLLLKIKYPPRRRPWLGKKVAIISLCVPSKESLDVVERQIKAMSEVEYPHDSWILDEGNNKQIQSWAKQYKVNYFSRKGIPKYNQDAPPFKAKSKAGNVNAWLDHVKRRKYEYFVQFDIDHNPKPEYLHKTLGFFRDKQIAWVQAPSVYKNFEHWTARGAAEQELVLQGPMQMGFYGHSSTPFIIGSHTTYRMSAIREIGGFQPTRAEDHLDTVALTSQGYRGIFLPEVIAEGDGPETLTTYFAQQFAWAYSMFQVLFGYGPKLIKKMPMRQKWTFLFGQTWYPLYSFSYLVMFACPIIALMLGREIAHVDRNEFIIHFLPLFFSGFFVWWASRPLMNPKNLFLSWRGILLHVVRWPVILIAIINAALGVKKPYMITPKGTYARFIPTFATYRPFLILGLLSASAVLLANLFRGEEVLRGQTVFALSNAMLMLTICLVDIDLRLRETGRRMIEKFRIQWVKSVSATAALMLIISSSFVTSPLVSNSLVSAMSPRAAGITQQDSSMGIPESKMSTTQLAARIASLPAADPAQPMPTLGIYSAQAVPRTNQPIIYHIFIGWDDAHYLAQQILYSQRNHNTLLVTIDPRSVADGATLLSGIADGTYDSKLHELAGVLSASKQPIYVRFAHEMDLANLYPWGSQDPGTYISAYRHVVEYMRTHGATGTQWIWSPAGNSGAEAYYPGDDVVDAVGTTVLEDSYWYGDTSPNFGDLISQRMWLFQLNKPVWITEFGAGTADPVYQQQLIEQARGQYQLAGFKTLVYLNMVDANIVGPDYHLQDPGVLWKTFGWQLPAASAVSAQASSEASETISQQVTDLCPPTTPSLLNAKAIPFVKQSCL